MTAHGGARQRGGSRAAARPGRALALSAALAPLAAVAASAIVAFVTLAVPALAASPAAVPVPPAAEQIAAAVLAAPEEWRAAAQVLGYDASGKLVVLRAGANDFVCLADAPAEQGWSVACYPKSLEPFMRRGRELRAEGLGDDQVTERRWKEADEGKLALPKGPATLYVLSGKGFDAAAGRVVEPYLRYVVYIPYATPESTGLALRPVAPGAPWLMFPGTAGAHIMINPPKDKTPPNR
ncbi:MAG: hypothetical protein U0X73_11705 [Thermoanaerobaculia bacterium]